MQAKKLTVAELRRLITEAMEEDRHKKDELAEDAETDAEAEHMRTAAAEDEDRIATMSESAHLERWKKLAGLLNS